MAAEDEAPHEDDDELADGWVELEAKDETGPVAEDAEIRSLVFWSCCSGWSVHPLLVRRMLLL